MSYCVENSLILDWKFKILFFPWFRQTKAFWGEAILRQEIFSSVLPTGSQNRLRQFTLYKNGLMTKNGYYLNFHVLLCNIIQKRNRHVSIPEMCWRQKKIKTSIMRLRSKIMHMKICLLHINSMIIMLELDCIKQMRVSHCQAKKIIPQW